MKKILALLAVGLFVSACGGEPTMDMSSPEKAKESTVKLLEKLSDEDKVKFQQATVKITTEVMTSGETDQAKMQAALQEKFQGKTAKQIIEMAK